jgi:uncharacterized ParB-like nuclease family protein
MISLVRVSEIPLNTLPRTLSRSLKCSRLNAHFLAELPKV